MMSTSVFIASPLERPQVARIAAAVPEVRLLYAPELLPGLRYIGDHKGAPRVRTAEETARWRAMLGEAEVCWDLPAGEDLPFAARLRWVQTTSTGVGQAVVGLGLHDVLVTTARGVHAGPLAEFVFMALLAHFRDLDGLKRAQAAREWTRGCVPEVAGRVMVTIGAGDLARGCAKIARALDMRVIAVGREAGTARAHNALFDRVVGVADLHDVLGAADAVVVTVPHTPATEGLVDAPAFAAMRDGVAFVNIGRGQVVDEAALIAALRSGKVGFAALDVARVEPLPAASPLWGMGNVLISPHSASTVASENGRIVDIFIHNLRCWVDGRTGDMRNVLDPARMY